MDDQWSEELRCPRCSNTGIASLSHFKGAYVPVVNDVSDGFEVVQTEYGVNFACSACSVSVEA
jgi:hypothetical protein